MVTDESRAYMEMYQLYKLGQMPLSGGFLEQPAKFIKSMKIIERTIRSEELRISNKRNR